MAVGLGIGDAHPPRGWVEVNGAGSAVDEKWYQQTIHFVENDQRARIYGVDITARQQAREELLKAYAEVEKRVVERTAELVELNKDLELEILNRKKAEKALRHRTMELKDQAIILEKRTRR